MKYTIVNLDTGCSLRSLPNGKFNTGNEKKLQVWSFSGKNGDRSPAITKALDLLKNKGYNNLKVVPLSDTDETPAEYEAQAAKSAIQKGTKQPKTKADNKDWMEAACKGMTGDEREAMEEFWAEMNPKCVPCKKNHRCGQSSKVLIYQCPQFEKDAA